MAYARLAAIQRILSNRGSRPVLSTATWNCTSNREEISRRQVSRSVWLKGIVSIDEYEVEVRGFANHAGTTPMPERRNALLAAARLIEAVQEVVTRDPGRQVGTVGRLEVSPNARNVVPGLVKHSIELRDLSSEKIARLGDEIQKRAQEIARDTKTEIVMNRIEHDEAAMATPGIQSQIEAASVALGLKTMRLPSGAGHDAQVMAKTWADGDDFYPERRRDQPLTERAFALDRLRQRRECADADGVADGPGVISQTRPGDGNDAPKRNWISVPGQSRHGGSGPRKRGSLRIASGKGSTLIHCKILDFSWYARSNQANASS